VRRAAAVQRQIRRSGSHRLSLRATRPYADSEERAAGGGNAGRSNRLEL
jgi:hypothetical protein